VACDAFGPRPKRLASRVNFEKSLRDFPEFADKWGPRCGILRGPWGGDALALAALNETGHAAKWLLAAMSGPTRTPALGKPNPNWRAFDCALIGYEAVGSKTRFAVTRTEGERCEPSATRQLIARPQRRTRSGESKRLWKCYRCMARVAGGQVELRTKSGLICTAWLPEIAQPLANVAGALMSSMARRTCWTSWVEVAAAQVAHHADLAVHDVSLAAVLCKPARPLETRANSHALHGPAWRPGPRRTRPASCSSARLPTWGAFAKPSIMPLLVQRRTWQSCTLVDRPYSKDGIGGDRV
jgi:hypothetical protein